MAANLLACRDGKHIVHVEHSLLPVCVPVLWPSPEVNGLVAVRELDVEPQNKRMCVLVLLAAKHKVCLKRQLLLGDGLDVNGLLRWIERIMSKNTTALRSRATSSRGAHGTSSAA